eukprot:758634-Hanusia_phi.AAC.5
MDHLASTKWQFAPGRTPPPHLSLPLPPFCFYSWLPASLLILSFSPFISSHDYIKGIPQTTVGWVVSRIDVVACFFQQGPPGGRDNGLKPGPRRSTAPPPRAAAGR